MSCLYNIGIFHVPVKAATHLRLFNPLKNLWLLRRCRDNDGSVTRQDVGWGGATSCGLEISTESQLLLDAERCNTCRLLYIVTEHKGP